jgi:zinc protease
MRLRALLISAFVALAALTPQFAHAIDVKTVAAAKGEEVWFVEDRTVPIVAISAALPAGSAYDPAGKDGLAAMAAALLDEGAGKMSSDAYHAALGNKAIRLSVAPGRDYTVIRLETLADNAKEAKEAFQLLGLALAHPRFDPDAIQRIRAQMIESLKQGEQDPPTVAARKFIRLFFAGHPYGHPVDGDAATLAAITQNDLRAFAHTHWVRGGLKIAVSGDIDEATLKTLLGAAFDAIPASHPAPPPPVAHMGDPGLHTIAMDVPQPTIEFGLPGIVRADKDFIPAYVANYILGGGGFSSELMKEVREKRGLTYGIDTDLSTYSRAGLFLGQVATKKESVKQTIEVVRRVMTAFAANGATPAELSDAKTYLTGSFPLAFDSNVGIAAQLNTFQRVGLAPDYIVKRNDLIDAVTLDDIKRVAKRLFNPAKMTVVIAGSFPDTKTPATAKPAP